MKVSELIAALEKIKVDHGDIEVYSRCDYEFVRNVDVEAGDNISMKDHGSSVAVLD